MDVSTTSLVVLFLFYVLQLVTLCNSYPLSTSSRWIVDQHTGKRVKLRCVNWVSHLQPMIAEGLEKKPVASIAAQIKATGFNCVRFTWPTFMFTKPEYGNLTVSQSLDKLGLKAAKAGVLRNNPQFINMNVVSVHQAVVDKLGKHNLMVVLDNHVSQPQWCCGTNDGNGFFGDASFNPDEWLLGLRNVAHTYKNHRAVIGMSMRNELRGPRQNEPDWYRYMQQGAITIHTESPNFLVIVSGFNFDTNLSFLKSKPFGVNINNKLVFEAHWYSFGTSAAAWDAQSNNVCARVTRSAEDNYLFLIRGERPFPLILSEFGNNQRGTNDADNRYIGCLLAALAENDIEWALWTFQGSYMLRQGIIDMEETYGVTDLNWDRPRNPGFLDRLQLIRHINQDPKSRNPTTYILYHPLSGLCGHSRKKNVVLGKCVGATRWDHQNTGSIKVAGTSLCLGIHREGAAAYVSHNCRSSWKTVSSSGLHLASNGTGAKYLCLEKNGADGTIVTKQCLCVGDSLADLPSCADNPQVQWFKFVPTNV